MSTIQVGEDSAIGDRSVISASNKSIIENTPSVTEIGKGVIIGQGSILHSCKIHDSVVIEMGSIILDGVEISEGSIITAGSLVPEGQFIPSGEVWSGVPAQSVRKVTEKDMERSKLQVKLWGDHATKHDEHHELTEQERENERLRIHNTKENPGYFPENIY